MKAVLLVGGEGTRLRPLTYDVPKPLLPIAEVPYLEQLVHYLSRFDVHEIILTACYLSHRIEEFCSRNQGKDFKLTYVIEESPLGTGGAVRNVADRLDETFLVFNGDILSNFNLGTLVRFHKSKKAELTLSLTPVEDPSRYGVADLREDGRIERFIEKPKKAEAPSPYINAGMYVVEPRALNLIPAHQKVSIETELFPKLASSSQLYGCVLNDYWLDMGTPADYLQAHYDFLDRKLPIKSLAAPEGKNWMGQGVRVDRGAHLISPVLLADGVVVESDATVGPFAVVGKRSVIESGARVERSVLWEGVRVGKSATLERSILGEGMHVKEGTHLIDQVLRAEEISRGQIESPR